MTIEQKPELQKKSAEEMRAEWEQIMAELHVIANTPVDMDKVRELERSLRPSPLDLLKFIG